MSHRAWRVGIALASALASALALYFGVEPVRVQARPQATFWYVTSVEDGIADPANCPGFFSCRLRDALVAAEPGDFILFDLPDDSVIELTAGELVVDRDLLIIGATANNLAISGNNSSRVFSVGSPLTMVSLTIEYGNAAGSGGGMYTNSPVTLHRVAFLTNTASDDGGGLYAENTVVLSDATFISNTSISGNGGGAYVSGYTSVRGGKFERNNAQRSFAADFGIGGGLVALAPLDLIGTQFLSNTSGNSGGGLATAFGTSATLADAAFIANTTRFLGGGMRAGGPLNLDHAQFLSNVSGSDGGGLSALGAAVVANTQFLSNTGGSGGGAFFARDTTLIGGSFYGNKCLFGGCTNGGVFGYSAHSTLALSQSVATGDDLDVWADWVNDGTFLQSVGTATFDTYFPLGVRGTGSTTFHHMRINPSQGISLFANINLTGDFTNAATLLPAGGSVTFVGSAAQRIVGSGATTFGNLAISNTGAGVSLGQDITVSTRLTLTSDLATTSGYTLFLTAGATAAGNGDVWGRTVRAQAFSLGTPYVFGNPFISVNFTAGTPPSAVRLDLSRAPSLNVGNTVRRGYSIEPVGGSGYVARLRLHYRDSELNGNTEGALQLWRYAGIGPWSPYSPSGLDTTDNWVENNNVTALSAWVISQYIPVSRVFLPALAR